MAYQELTEYERRRIENIKRNDEMLASLKIHSKLTDLFSATKRPRAQTKSYKVSPEKKSKTETPVVIRRSLRSRGLPPDSSSAGGLTDGFYEALIRKTPKSQTTYIKRPIQPGPLTMRDAYVGDDSDKKLIETIIGVSNKLHSSSSENSNEGIDGDSCNTNVSVNNYENAECPEVEKKVWGSINLESLKLEPQNIERVVPGRITSVKFFPTAVMRMIAVGNKFGDVGFWNVNAEEDWNGIYLYRPHSGHVSGISIQPFSISKMFTGSCDGFIRLMDVEKEVFNMVYSSDYAIFSISQRPNDVKSLYFSEGQGQLGIWDERAGKSCSSWSLHEGRINTIDFNSENTNTMVTSSTDGTARIWDLRNIDADKPKSLKRVSHKRAVNSAYFSPSGSCLATTSVDNIIGLLSGANYEDMSMVYHYNQTGRWISTFRGIWGWDDSQIFIGNMGRGVDVISVAGKKIVATLQSKYMSAISCRFDVHPYNVGMLAGTTSGGQVYMWTSC